MARKLLILASREPIPDRLLGAFDLYRSPIGKVLLTGGVHDATWAYIEEHYKEDVTGVDLSGSVNTIAGPPR